MNFQTQLFELIRTNNSQVPNLRSRAINGNQQTLQAFISVILKLLTTPNMHQIAYKQINQFLISGNPDIAQQIDRKIMDTVVKNYCQQKLEQYIIFWRRIMSGSGSKSLYPNLNNRLQSIHINNENKILNQKFINYNKQFEKNLLEYNDKKIEFFEDEDDFLSASSISGDQGQQIGEINLLQIKKIKNILENQQINQNIRSEYLLKAINFISFNRKNIKNQIKDQYQQYYKWANQFISTSTSSNNQYHNMNKNKLINQSIQKQKLKQLQKSRHIKQMDKQKEKEKQKLKQKQKLRQKQKQKINRNRMNQNNIMKSRINMVDQQEQIIINKQEIPKKTLSKRFNLDSIKKQQKDHIIKDNNHQNEYKKQIQNNILDKRPQTIQLKRIPPFSYYKVRMTSPQIDIKFIQDTQQLQNFMNQQNSPNIQKNESLRRNIFPHSSTQLKPIQSAKQEEIIIKKYGGRRQQINKQYSITPYQYTYQTPISKNTQRKQLKTQKYLNSHSPSTAFNYRGQGSNYKKLSEFNRQKKQRRRQIENQPLSKIQDYIILPYLQNFNNLNNFNHYRSNCLQDNSLLYGSPLLFITFSATRISYAKLKVQILYQNKCDVDLSIQTLYRVPKSMKVNKQSTIKKKWVLSDSNSHSFCLQIVSFPIQPCLINLKYAYECNHDDFKKYQPTIISLPITIRNFCQYLIINEYQWVQKWIEWTENMNYKGVKNIILQNQVVNENNLELILKQFIKFNPVEGYSIKQFGLYSRQLEMTFLLRISQRIGQILTIEVLSDRKNITQDQIDYLEYCLNTWSMLLAKIQFQNQAD